MLHTIFAVLFFSSFFFAVFSRSVEKGWENKGKAKPKIDNPILIASLSALLFCESIFGINVVWVAVYVWSYSWKSIFFNGFLGDFHV